MQVGKATQIFVIWSHDVLHCYGYFCPSQNIFIPISNKKLRYTYRWNSTCVIRKRSNHLSFVYSKKFADKRDDDVSINYGLAWVQQLNTCDSINAAPINILCGRHLSLFWNIVSKMCLTYFFKQMKPLFKCKQCYFYYFTNPFF